MKINCTTTFKEGKETFHEGDQRTVSDEDGARFISNGWAAEVGAEAAPAPAAGPVSLDIHDSTIGVEDNHG